MITAAKKRPLSAVCLILFLLLLLAKEAGLEIFGKPPDHPLLDAYVESGESVRILGTITDRIPKARSVQYILSNSYLQSEKQSIPLYTISVTATDEKELAVGSVVLVSGSISRPEQASNPGQFDQRSYYTSQRIYYSVFLKSCKVLKTEFSVREKMLRIRDLLLAKAEEAAGPGSESVLKAMLLGDRSELSPDLKRSYQVGGILHILAISGMHIALLGQGLLKLLQKVRLPFPVAAGMTFLLLVLYCLMTGAAPSSVRAVCMFTVLLGGRLLLRTYDPPSSLALAGILILLDNPAILFASSFQLSFGAILAVSVCWPSVSWLLPGQVRKPAKLKKRSGLMRGEKWELAKKAVKSWGFYFFRLWLRYAFFWITVNVAMFPLTIYYYYEISLWGLIPNLLMMPVMPFLIGVGTIGLLTACWNLPLARILLYPLEFVLTGIRQLMNLIQNLPCATVVCGKPAIGQVILSGLLLAILSLLLWRGKQAAGKTKGRKRKSIRIRYRKIGFAGMIVVLLVLLLRFQPAWSLTMLDVGQGDCLVLKNRSSVFLVDGGSSSVKEVGRYRILPYLKSQGIEHIDGIFLTHPDEDHCNGLKEVFLAVEEKEVTLSVDRLYLPLWMEGSEEEEEMRAAALSAGAEVCYLARGDRIHAGITDIEVLNPFPKGGIQSGNSGSLVLSVRNGDFDALLTGDLESDGENMLLPLEHSYEYLKTAHHGSKGSSSKAFLQEVRPTVAAISAPEKSTYGHPHKETLERLADAGAEIYCTRDCGAVRVEGNKKSWRLWGYLSSEKTLPDR